jgi:hypothetical protein
MGRVSGVFLSLILLIAWLSAVVPAAAEPILVTSGSFVGAGALGAGFGLGFDDIDLNGPRFQLTTAVEESGIASARLTNLSTFPPEDALVDFSTSIQLEETLIAGLDGSPVVLAAPATMSFTASPTHVACRDEVFRGPVCIGVAPFTFDADLALFGSARTLHLVGGGTVEGELFRRSIFGDGFSTVVVQFNLGASPTPEPATLSLLTTGAIITGAGMLRRRRACRATT